MNSKLLLDLRGLVIRSMYSEKDPDKEKGELPDPEWGVSKFITGPFLNCLKIADPVDMVAVLDGGNDYRRNLYSDYKAHRKESQPGEKELISEVSNRVERFLRYMGVTTVSVKGVEADDMIALLCQKISGQKVVMTVDQDLIQLHSSDTIIMINGEVKEDMKGVLPHHIPLYKSIVGDSSDGYKGIPGLGPAAWKKIVDEVGDDGVMELSAIVAKGDRKAMREVASAYSEHKVIPKLWENWGEWRRCYYLAILHPEICYTTNKNKIVFPEWERRVPSREKVLEILDTNYVDDGVVPVLEEFLPRQFLITEDNLEILPTIIEEFKKGPFVAFDYETEDFVKHPNFNLAKKSGKDYVDSLSSQIVSVSFAGGKNLRTSIYISVLHSDEENRVPKDVVQSILKELTAYNVKLVAHNATFEYTLTKQDLGISLEGIEDTMAMSSYYREEDSSGLKDLSMNLLRYRQATFEETTQGRGMSELTSAEALQYGLDDSIVTAHIRSLFDFILSCETKDISFVEENEKAFVNLLAQTFPLGVEIDWDRVKELENKDRERVKELEDSIRQALFANCSSYNPENVQRFWTSIESETKALIGHKNKYSDPDVIKSKMEDLKAKLLENSKYVPYRSVGKKVKFVPTAKGITSVGAEIGIPETIEKLTGSELTNYIARVKANTEDKKTFLKLLAQASADLKKREGPNYEKFYQFCYEVLERSAPEVFEGFEMNLGSTEQKKTILYLFLGLPVRVRSTPAKDSVRDTLGVDGSPSTSDEAIEYALAFDVEKGGWKEKVLEELQELTSCKTRISLYWEPYPNWKHPLTGKIHPGFIPSQTRTRRPTGTSPNFLQLSKGDVRSIVKGHKTDKGRTLIVAGDFNGQELRITGSESRDPTMIEAYCGQNRKDIHTVTAIGVASRYVRENPEMRDYFKVSSEGKVDYDTLNLTRKDKDLPFHKEASEWRAIAKTVNFLIIYGGSAFTLAKKLRISEREAEDILREVFALYGRLEPWQREVVELARSRGYVETAYGNRIHASEDLFSTNDSKRRKEERKLINGVVQPCASDVLKVVSRNIQEERVFKDLEARLIAPVYDEICSSVLQEHAFEYIRKMDKCMSIEIPGHEIPMEAEFSIGYNWGDMIELGFGKDITEDSIQEALEKLNA